MSAAASLVGCGILKNETLFLKEKNGWNIDTHFACSSLHVNFEKLSSALVQMLNNAPENAIVLYGQCHPLIDRMMLKYRANRVQAQNCIVMLLGEEVFTRELKKRAFFLLEDWAKRWDFVTRDVFGEGPDAMREILRSAHDHFLCLRTPCSGDFAPEAEALSQRFDMPLEWRDISLDILEMHIDDALKRAMKGGVVCP